MGITFLNSLFFLYYHNKQFECNINSQYLPRHYHSPPRAPTRDLKVTVIPGTDPGSFYSAAISGLTRDLVDHLDSGSVARMTVLRAPGSSPE
jgi:hypothetical protein